MKSIKDFSVGELIGKGGFGKVYRAVLREGDGKDESDARRTFAIKVMSKRWLKDKGLLARVAEEIKLQLSLKRHPHIVRMHSFFENKAHLFLVLELCEKGNLFHFLKKHKPLDREVVRRWFGEIVSAVAHLHENDIVHRDLKLSNILVTNELHVKISDFGLAARIEDREHHTICGTPCYMAPEVRHHNRRSGLSYDPVQADLWSLGCLLYTMLNDGKHLEPKQRYQRTEKIRQDVAHDLLTILLNYKEDRSTAAEILLHPYLKGTEAYERAAQAAFASSPSRGGSFGGNTTPLRSHNSKATATGTAGAASPRVALVQASGGNKENLRNPHQEDRRSYVRIHTGDVRGVQHVFGSHLVQIRRDGAVVVTVVNKASRTPREIIVSEWMPARYSKLQQFAAKAVSILASTTPKVVLKLSHPETMLAAVIGGVARVWLQDRQTHATYDLSADVSAPTVRIGDRSYPVIEMDIYRKQAGSKTPVYYPVIVNDDQVTLPGVGTGMRTAQGHVNVHLEDGTDLTLDRSASVLTCADRSYALLPGLASTNLPVLPTELRSKLRQAQAVVNQLLETAS
ncbi:Protein kinase, putative [Hondaea fermentalgiana]|uniref:Protein kinase, putative n=1 Tax=Hondaea fermentalgiana TaxID=2315210 RepID=A0A2R5G3S9_9STRA|nr:Protein kinase, putative [Hondaea fermentalgiana]|eukprot:GBG25670.1 Protein kinase, putative [Hondaea fermentalgiana]